MPVGCKVAFMGNVGPSDIWIFLRRDTEKLSPQKTQKMLLK